MNVRSVSKLLENSGQLPIIEKTNKNENTKEKEDFSFKLDPKPNIVSLTPPTRKENH